MIRYIPNTLTLSRVAAIPLLLLLYPDFKHACGLVIFLVAMSDIFDGRIARWYKVESKFGSHIDPITDKMFDAATFLILVGGGVLSPWFAVVIICRDILISGIRLVALEQKFSIDVHWSGKIKSLFTAPAVFGLFINEEFLWIPCHEGGMFFMWVTLFFTLYSGFIYLNDFRIKYMKSVA